MIKNIEIKDFRQLSNHTVTLGRYLTIISGINMTGKSTLLGMIGNSCELILSKRTKGLFKTKFQTNFSEIFKGSEKYDKSGSEKFRVNFCYDDFSAITDFRDFRVTWQTLENHKKRFRVIPYKATKIGKRTSKKENKFQWPVTYLGLSRLYPIGESTEIKSKCIEFNEDETEWFINTYKGILSIYDENIESIESIRISETSKKEGICVSTTTYDYCSNSAGQDNIGQILYALLSFKRLKDFLADKYEGGLILIDEIDSTLHPIAQNKLIDVLINGSKEWNLQIVCTTHSLSLLEYVCSKTNYNDENESVNNIEIVYFSNSNKDKKIEIERNPKFYNIKNNLMIQSVVQNAYRIKIYTEDAEARWFLSKLLVNFTANIEILDVKLGWTELLSLYKGDLEYFSNVLIILDGDASREEINKKSTIGKYKASNIIQLPDFNKSPEKVFYEYVTSLDNQHPYWEKSNKFGFNYLYFKEHNPLRDYSSTDQEKDNIKKKREYYKEWFNEHRAVFEQTKLYDYWEKDNKIIVEKFIKEFKESYNKIAKKNFMSEIPD